MGKGNTNGGGPTPLNQLFEKTDPAKDGEECLRDCDGCAIKYPRGFKIEESDLIYGMVKEWSTHALIATGKTDWVRDSSEEKGSVMEAIEKADKPTNGVSSLMRWFFYHRPSILQMSFFFSPKQSSWLTLI